MLTAVTLLSSPFLSVCVWQQLLWTTLKRGVRGLIQVPACKPDTYISGLYLTWNTIQTLCKCLENTRHLGYYLTVTQVHEKARGFRCFAKGFILTFAQGLYSANSTAWPAATHGTHIPPVQKADACSKRFILFWSLFSILLSCVCMKVSQNSL